MKGTRSMMCRKRWMPGFLVAMGASLLCGQANAWEEDLPLLTVVVARGLSVEPGDAACAADDDCVVVPNTCSTCGCGVPINKRVMQQYIEQMRNLCEGYSGGFCDSYCPTPFARCVAGRCVLSER